MSYTYEELRKVSDEKLIAAHDKLAQNTVITAVDWYLNEMSRRRVERQGQTMIEQGARVEQLTRYIFWLTLVVTVATIVNVGIVAWSLL